MPPQKSSSKRRSVKSAFSPRSVTLNPTLLFRGNRLDTVRVTETFHTVFYATLYVAQARGEFTRQGLQVTLELLPPGTSTLGILR